MVVCYALEREGEFGVAEGRVLSDGGCGEYLVDGGSQGVVALFKEDFAGFEAYDFCENGRDIVEFGGKEFTRGDVEGCEAEVILQGFDGA